MEIRELKARDIKTLAHILGKLKPESVTNLRAALVSASDVLSAGLTIFHIAASDLTDDVYAWLADLIGASVDEFDEMPFSTPIDIIKGLVNRGDFKDFFGSALSGVETQSPEPTTSSKPVTVGKTKK